jgi:hypothetical protein
MTIDWGIALQVGSYAVLAIGGYFALRHAVQEALRVATEALRRADAAHARIDKQSEDTSQRFDKHSEELQKLEVSVRVDLARVMTRLDGLDQIHQRLDALMLAFKGERA